MHRLTWLSKSGLIAQQNKMDSISNNMANTTTTGYKKVDVGFSDLLQESLNRRGYPIVDRNNPELEHSSGVKSNEWVRNDRQGDLKETGRPVDLAIDGRGYFQVTTSNGEKAYTRDGSFLVDKNGDLVNSNGYKVTILKNGQEVSLNSAGIKVTGENIIIDDDGNIFLKDGNSEINVGQIKVVDFVGNKSLLSVGDNLFKPKENVDVINNPDYSVRSGFLEMSNVDLGEEMTELIITQRAFQMNTQALRTTDEMWSMVNNMRGK